MLAVAAIGARHRIQTWPRAGRRRPEPAGPHGPQPGAGGARSDGSRTRSSCPRPCRSCRWPERAVGETAAEAPRQRRAGAEAAQDHRSIMRFRRRNRRHSARSGARRAIRAEVAWAAPERVHSRQAIYTGVYWSRGRSRALMGGPRRRDRSCRDSHRRGSAAVSRVARSASHAHRSCRRCEGVKAISGSADARARPSVQHRLALLRLRLLARRGLLGLARLLGRAAPSAESDQRRTHVNGTVVSLLRGVLPGPSSLMRRRFFLARSSLPYQPGDRRAHALAAVIGGGQRLLLLEELLRTAGDV